MREGQGGRWAQPEVEAGGGRFSQTGGGSRWVRGEGSGAAGSGIGLPLRQDGQRIRPSGPVGGWRDLHGREEAQAAETGRKEHKERDGAGWVRKRCLFTQKYEESSPHGVVVSRCAREGGTVRSRCCARGAAQKVRSHAACKSGRRGSSWSSWASLSRRAAACAATKSELPIRTP